MKGKVHLDVLFEQLHRYVYDYYFQPNGLYLKHNSFKEKLAYKIYCLLFPLFKGWRGRLKTAYPNNVKYIRYND